MAVEKKLKSERAYWLVRDELRRYTKKLSSGYDKVRKRFIGEMITGMVRTGRLLLSRIAGAVHDKERTSDVHADEKRLSRELKSERWESDTLEANHRHVVAGSGFLLDEETRIAIDIFDVNKEGGHVFEHLTRVHDGSKGETVDGFWAIAIEAIRGKGDHLPLYMELFSDKAKGYAGQFTEMRKAVEKVVEGFGHAGLWVMDRGFDALQNMLYFQGQTLHFLIRGFRPREVERTRGVKEKVLEIVRALPLRGVDAFFKYYALSPSGRRRKWVRHETKMRYDVFRIDCVHGLAEEERERERLPLWVIVSEGVGRPTERAFFYTNRPVESLSEALHLLKQYAQRWSVEEAIRFVKQAFGLEDIRVQSYRSLQRMMTFCLLSYTFLCLGVRRWPGKAKTLYWWLYTLLPRRSSEQLPHFAHYRLFEAIQKVLALDFFGALEPL